MNARIFLAGQGLEGAHGLCRHVEVEVLVEGVALSRVGVVEGCPPGLENH